MLEHPGISRCRWSEFLANSGKRRLTESSSRQGVFPCREGHCMYHRPSRMHQFTFIETVKPHWIREISSRHGQTVTIRTCHVRRPRCSMTTKCFHLVKGSPSNFATRTFHRRDGLLHTAPFHIGGGCTTSKGRPSSPLGPAERFVARLGDEFQSDAWDEDLFTGTAARACFAGSRAHQRSPRSAPQFFPGSH